jgi:hypothetical protein
MEGQAGSVRERRSKAHFTIVRYAYGTLNQDPSHDMYRRTLVGAKVGNVVGKVVGLVDGLRVGAVVGDSMIGSSTQMHVDARVMGNGSLHHQRGA